MCTEPKALEEDEWTVFLETLNVHDRKFLGETTLLANDATESKDSKEQRLSVKIVCRVAQLPILKEGLRLFTYTPKCTFLQK